MPLAAPALLQHLEQARRTVTTASPLRLQPPEAPLKAPGKS
jgi:hypothetical protein